MSDQLDKSSAQSSISEKPEAWSWDKRPKIKRNRPKKDFEFNPADAVREALGDRAFKL
jgi:hypothetical protein